MSHTHTQSGREEPAGGWESAGRVPLTRRLNYSCIRSELWETAPPKHTHGLGGAGGRAGRQLRRQAGGGGAGPGALPAAGPGARPPLPAGPEPAPPPRPRRAGRRQNEAQKGGTGEAGWQPRSRGGQTHGADPRRVVLAPSDTALDLRLTALHCRRGGDPQEPTGLLRYQSPPNPFDLPGTALALGRPGPLVPPGREGRDGGLLGEQQHFQLD